ncbi:hypothetical protein ACH4UM_35530 [Streptomyces sp. NPDC020801]|uniref:hypothetical protein n=1 Tax=unclassified Streptomyces TaxID=2593676 RepID=UPI0037A3872C
MSHAVAALGAAALTAAGCVWYLPALADLRAGADRPDSRRIAAAACVTGWAGTGALALLLLVAEGWWTPCVAAAVGATATTALRLDAAVQRRREARETARHWARLGHVPPPAGPGRSRHVVAAVVGCGVAAAVAVAVLHAVAGPDGDAGWVTAAAPAAVMGVFLITAATYAWATRRTTSPRRTTASGRTTSTRHTASSRQEQTRR